MRVLSHTTVGEIEDIGYTWHHMDDINENLECTMQLVSESPHRAPHSGACKLFEEITQIKYKS